MTDNDQCFKGIDMNMFIRCSLKFGSLAFIHPINIFLLSAIQALFYIYFGDPTVKKLTNTLMLIKFTL